MIPAEKSATAPTLMMANRAESTCFLPFRALRRHAGADSVVEGDWFMARSSKHRVPLWMVLAPLVTALAGLTSAASAIDSDYNGDGFADLAIGIPKEDVGPGINAGAICIIYGSA